MIDDQPNPAVLFCASVLAMLISEMLFVLVGAGLGFLLALPGLGAGSAPSFANVPGIIGLLLMASMMAVVFGPIALPWSVLLGVLLYTVIGRALATREVRSGRHRRSEWIIGGATVGLSVGVSMTLSPSGSLISDVTGLWVLAVAVPTGILGMLVWRASLRAFSGSGGYARG